MVREGLSVPGDELELPLEVLVRVKGWRAEGRARADVRKVAGARPWEPSMLGPVRTALEVCHSGVGTGPWEGRDRNQETSL